MTPDSFGHVTESLPPEKMQRKELIAAIMEKYPNNDPNVWAKQKKHSLVEAYRRLILGEKMVQ